MESYKIQLIETMVVFVGYLVAYYVINKFLNNTLKQALLQRDRRKKIVKAMHFFAFTTSVVLLSAIWGLEQGQIAVFLGTLVTALGIGFFAQWSLLSNITSGLLLFFNHPAKIGDRIKVLDKDFPMEGEITDLTYFFVHLKTDDGQIIIPNSVLLQKPISFNPEGAIDISK